VHPLAERVVRRIKRRVTKKYLPRTDRGNVEHIARAEMVDFSEGSWLVLAQAAYFLSDITADLRSRGYLFNYRGRRSISESLSDAVNGWEQLRKGKQVTGKTARTIYNYMSVNDRVKRGFKKLPALDDDEMVTLDELIAHHGLLANVDMIWHMAMDKMPSADRAYITALLRRGEKFNAEPRINLSTIHGSKGGEADNVVLFTEISPAASKAAELSPDDLHRVFYVGITRTKQNLYLVEPDDATRSYQI
jgi:superfamily I DNA/RNA helicase